MASSSDLINGNDGSDHIDREYGQLLDTDMPQIPDPSSYVSGSRGSAPSYGRIPTHEHYDPSYPYPPSGPALSRTIASAAREGNAWASSCVASFVRLPRWLRCLIAGLVLFAGYRGATGRGTEVADPSPQSLRTKPRPLFRPKKGESARHNDASLGASFCGNVGDYYFGDSLVTYKGHSYQLIGSPGAGMSYFDALQLSRMRCVGGYPGYLVAIESEEENFFLAEMVQSKTRTTSSDVWIGGNDMLDSGTYQWLASSSKTDGKVFWKTSPGGGTGGPKGKIYQNFAEGEPVRGGTNGVAEKHCVFLHAQNTNQGKWWSESCYRELQYAIIEFNGLSKAEKKKNKQKKKKQNN